MLSHASFVGVRSAAGTPDTVIKQALRRCTQMSTSACVARTWVSCSGGAPATQCGAASRAVSAYSAGCSPPSATCTVFDDMSLPTTYILQSSKYEAFEPKQCSGTTEGICVRATPQNRHTCTPRSTNSSGAGVLLTVTSLPMCTCWRRRRCRPAARASAPARWGRRRGPPRCRHRPGAPGPGPRTATGSRQICGGLRAALSKSRCVLPSLQRRRRMGCMCVRVRDTQISAGTIWHMLQSLRQHSSHEASGAADGSSLLHARV